MDIAGAKVLKRRLGANAADDATPRAEGVPADAPPVYHWVGVRHNASEDVPADADGDASSWIASLLRRLGLSSR